MHLGIIGAGNVGGSSVGALPESAPRSPLESAILRACDMVLLATPWAGAVAAVTELNPSPGQIVIDCTTPIAGRLEGLDPGSRDSGGETIQRAVPTARVVKAFNTCGVEVMADPLFPSGHAAMPVCSDDASARQAVMELARAIGFDPMDLGPLKQSRYREPMAMVWIIRSVVLGAGRRWAFAIAQ